MSKRYCGECGHRRALYWRPTWKKIGADRDHDLCPRCHDSIENRFYAIRLLELERSNGKGGDMNDELIREVLDFLRPPPAFMTQAEVEVFYAERGKQRDRLIRKLESQFRKLEAQLASRSVPQADGDAGHRPPMEIPR